MGELPRLSLLGYQASRPRLRLLRLPSEEVLPSPVPLNRPVALDRAVVREGWVAFSPDTEVWGVPLPLEGEAFKVGDWWDCRPALNPRTVWLARPYEGDPALVVEYDGVARAEVGRAELPPGKALLAATPEGLVLGDGADTLTLAGEPVAPGRDVLAAHGSKLAVLRGDGELLLADTAARTTVAVDRPLPGAWVHDASFAPDGLTLALGVGVDSEGGVGAGGDYAPRWTRLALIDAATGAVALADGRFDNFCTAPVWAPDGRWLVFDAPFDKSLFACEVATRRLTPFLRRRGRPSPLAAVAAPGRRPA